MSSRDRGIIQFNGSPEHFEILFDLEKSLDYKIKEFGSVEMLKYQASLIPEICKPLTEFLEVDGKIIGYAYSGHNHWAFEASLLDSNLSFPSQESYLEVGEIFLRRQIDRARSISGVKTLRGWLFQANQFMESFYERNGFEITHTEYVSEIIIRDFDDRKFFHRIEKVEKSGIRIEDLRSLQDRYPDWEQKLYLLWMAIENDVPTDLVEPTQTIDNWRRTLMAPWFNPFHVYIALDGNEWIGLSSYDRGDTVSDSVSTDLTGVLPEYRRCGICSALKVHALKKMKEEGAKRIFTSNEENNPMFEINLALGFKKIGTESACKLELQG